MIVMVECDDVFCGDTCIRASMLFYLVKTQEGARDGAVVEALRYKSEGRGFDS
jgi:hypothetical protein